MRACLQFLPNLCFFFPFGRCQLLPDFSMIFDGRIQISWNPPLNSWGGKPSYKQFAKFLTSFCFMFFERKIHSDMEFVRRPKAISWMVDFRSLKKHVTDTSSGMGKNPGRIVRWWCENAYYFERSSSGTSVLCGGWMECILATITGETFYKNSYVLRRSFGKHVHEEGLLTHLYHLCDMAYVFLTTFLVSQKSTQLEMLPLSRQVMEFESLRVPLIFGIYFNTLISPFHL